MKVIGVDIGTTSISAVVLHGKSGEVLETVSLDNNAAIQGAQPWEALQDAAEIFAKTKQLLSRLIDDHTPVKAIGLTGQMHGIVYVNSEGEAISPLYTWQDGRGEQLTTNRSETETYAAKLSRLSGYKLATGFGAVTHYYNNLNHLVPVDAVSICTIHDYIGMKLTGRKRPLMHNSDAASLGLFQVGDFDREVIRNCFSNQDIFPAVTSELSIIGETPESIPVIVAIGDNQASFIGSVRDMAESVVINIGTSGQISALDTQTQAERTSQPRSDLDTTTQAEQASQLRTELETQTQAEQVSQLRSGLEIRPLNGDKYIAVGAALCGGKAYAHLESFFQSVLDMAGIPPRRPGERLFPAMNLLAEAALEQQLDMDEKDNCKDEKTSDSKLMSENSLKVSTRFSGSRNNPSERGSITGIGMNNFDARHLVTGVLEGMVEELYNYYEELGRNAEHRLLSGSGNAIRRNPVLRKIASNRFGLPLMIPQHTEEAAYGAALSALTGVGFCSSLEEAQQLIRYIEG